MIPPTTALNRYAANRNKHALYLNETRDELHYGFRIGDLNFLLKPKEKIEVIEAAPACPIPNTPGWFSGMVNLRGDLLPVFDINFLITKNPVKAKWIMIFRHNGRSAGIYIDTLPSGITLEICAESEINLPDILQGCTENIYMQDNNTWIETDFEKLFQKLRARF